MNQYLIRMKFAVLLYLVTSVVLQNSNKNPLLILVILFYSSITMVTYIIDKPVLKKVFILLSAILPIVLFQSLLKEFVLFLPISIYEVILVFDLSENLYSILNIGILFLLNKELISVYILLVPLTFFMMKLAMKDRKKIDRISRANDNLINENFKLNCKINNDLEYENQLRYVSQLEERNNIAQQMHDNIGHTLAASLMQLEAANLLMNRDIERAKGLVENTIYVLREGMEKIRTTLRNIKPPSEQIGLSRIQLLLDKFMKDHSIDVSLVYKENLDRISFIQWKVICENTKECLTNSLKYSQATKITLNIMVLNKLTKVEIKDNGVGQEKHQKGLGIRGIEERTEGIGGKVVIDGSNGFSVILLLPIDESR